MKRISQIKFFAAPFFAVCLVFLMMPCTTLAGNGEWTWMDGLNTVNKAGVYGTKGAPDPANVPGARWASVAFADGTGNLWLFGGNGRDSVGSDGYMNDLWHYDPASQLWTWMSGSNTINQAGVYGTKGTPDAVNVPGARLYSTGSADSSGTLWLFGGMQYGYLNDLWRYDPSTQMWTWMSGSDTVDQAGVYGTKGTPDPANVPGARRNSTSWIDDSGCLWLFGGGGFDSGGAGGSLNDLWRYDPVTQMWTWISGSDTVNQAGVYGTKGTPDPANVPGARHSSISWIDGSGCMWLFGGSVWATGYLNDLWRFDPATQMWTWMSGSNTGYQAGVYGTKGTPDPANMPGARESSISWLDGSGILWLFGGRGRDSGTGNTYLNDLWRYDPDTGLWTWMSGSDTVMQPSVYGTKGTPDPANVPGARDNSISLIDGTGTLFLFGGSGMFSTSSSGTLNDLWRYEIPECIADSDCAGEKLCNVTIQTCVECLKSDDCSGGYVCVDNECTLPVNPVQDNGDPNERSCNPGSYTDLGNGIVRDNVTGMEWVQDGNLIASRDPSFDSDGRVTWQQALDYIAVLNNDEYLGYSDWRLPTIEELSSLVDTGHSNPAINPLFSGTLAGYYWSSTTYVYDTPAAWRVDFYYGNVDNFNKIFIGYVRAVRGASYEILDNFVINSDGTVTDIHTGLMWQHCHYGQTWNGSSCTGYAANQTWEQAIAYVQELNTTQYLEYNDWRLPTRNELRSLLDYSRCFPATSFPNVASYYWSSTTSVSDTSEAWDVDFDQGRMGASYKGGYIYARAVRGGPCISHGDWCIEDSDCDDGVFCNGLDTCDNKTCSAGTPDCADEEYCDEDNDLCVDCLENAHCDDGEFCNGPETCVNGLCETSNDPCADNATHPFCDEANQHCLECLNNTDCSDGQFCTGSETCASGVCVAGTDPCAGATPECNEATDSCVECLNDTHCDPGYICSGTACTPRGTMQAYSVSLKAGKTANTDSMKLSGTLNATPADLATAINGTVTVTIEAAYIPEPGAITYTFQVPPASVSSGKYTSPKLIVVNKADPVTSFSLDTNTGAMKFSAKNVDLTGLKCPITFRVEFGDYAAEKQLDELIVNGTKLSPLPLLWGVMDSLDAVKVSGKKGTTPGTDSVKISGTFTIDGSINPASPVVLTLGSDTFTVPGNTFLESSGKYSCKSVDIGTAFISAKFDTVKCTYSIQIKNADITGSGNVAFGLNVFGNALQSTGGITLPLGF